MNTNISRRNFSRITGLAVASLAAGSRVGLAQGKFPQLNAELGVVPDLPYAFDALAPYIDAQTMEIHHDKHHAGYVANLSKAIAGQSGLQGKSLQDLLRGVADISDAAVQTAVRNNGGCHWNHSFFWNIMAPAGKGGKPSDKLAAAIKKSFGSEEECRQKFAAAGGSRFGSGWAWLIVKDGEISVCSTPNQDNPLMQGIVDSAAQGIPILGIDVWEHAYYLNYQNRRADYIEAWWNVVNWERVNEYFEAAV